MSEHVYGLLRWLISRSTVGASVLGSSPPAPYRVSVNPTGGDDRRVV